MINLVRLSEGKELPRFQQFRSPKTSNKFLNSLQKDNKCRDIIRWKYVCCMYGKVTFIKLNQLRYDSLSRKYHGTSVQVLIAFNGIVFLLVKL